MGYERDRRDARDPRDDRRHDLDRRGDRDRRRSPDERDRRAPRDRDYDRDRSPDGRDARRRDEGDRDRSRDRDRNTTVNTAASPTPPPAAKELKEALPIDHAAVDVDAENQMLAQMMGMRGFGTSKTKQIEGNEEGYSKKKSNIGFRQFMNIKKARPGQRR